MSRISVPDTAARRAAGRGGFSLVEVLVGSTLAAIVLAAVLSTYLFMGRSLTRLANSQEQDVKSRRALRLFTNDVSAAIQLTTATESTLTLTKTTAGANVTVSYVYSSAAGTLSRTQGTATQKLLTGLTACTITYYNPGGSVVTSSISSVKAAELSFSTSVGTAKSGTAAKYATVSPRVVMRNKPVLQ